MKKVIAYSESNMGVNVYEVNKIEVKKDSKLEINKNFIPDPYKKNKQFG